MKQTIIAIAALLSSITAMANHPDSVYVRPDIRDGDHSMYVAYSLDKKHWKHIGCKLFDGDYGPWGSQKKIYYPVLSFDGKKFHATFIPDPKYLTDYKQAIRTTEKYGQIATTESNDFCLWKPQDYPFIEESKYKKLLEDQKSASANNIITVPYSAVKALMEKARIKAQDAQWESENYVATAAPIAQQADDITVKITAHHSNSATVPDASPSVDTKPISDKLMGVFFEDISYAADGGLYAELIQNRDFEYTDKDHNGWNAQTAWSLQGNGTKITILDGNATVPDASPSGYSGISKNNPHYALLSTTTPGAKLINEGWNGIALKAKAKYDLSLFINGKGKIKISLVSGDKVLASCTVSGQAGWKQQKATLIPTADATDAKLVIEPLQAGDLALDFISLFPKDTFHGHANGLRKDLAQTIADMHPRFVRFPGGCATHGQGIDNIYHWKASIGDLWDRKPDMNIWHYHQTRGLGFYEYFQFCEDMGAEPLPVLSAGVPCQNSWAGGNGQNGGIPWAKEVKNTSAPSVPGTPPVSDTPSVPGNPPASGTPSVSGVPPVSGNMLPDPAPLTMESYLQELLDLIEWANGDAKTSKLAQMRAKAGHPKPFNMKYLGIGNEDLLNDTFNERYLYLINNIKKTHPEITIVGTVGPFWEGSDYEYGWQVAKENHTDIVDEHYYNSPGWYFHHRDFYDNYDAATVPDASATVPDASSTVPDASAAVPDASPSATVPDASPSVTKVYLGEWASHGTNCSNALIEAAYLANVERNADKVVMASYAPLLAKDKHTNWNPSLIYFSNTAVNPTANYYVQRVFGQNSGDTYVYSDAIVDYKQQNANPKNPRPLLSDIQNRIDKSIVIDSKTGDVIVKIISLLPKEVTARIDLHSIVDAVPQQVTVTTLAQPASPDRSKAWAANETKKINAENLSHLKLPAWSVTVIRVSSNQSKSRR